MKVQDDERLKSVIEKRGVELVSFCISTQIANYAGKEIAEILDKHRSRRGIKALITFGQEMNGISIQFMLLKGWSDVVITETIREIESALEQRIQLIH